MNVCGDMGMLLVLYVGGDGRGKQELSTMSNVH